MFKTSSLEDVICCQDEATLVWSTLSFAFFLVDGLLVDTGPSALATKRIVFFNKHKIDQVVLTHVHEDHCGMAGWLQKYKQVPVYIHRDVVEDASRKAKLPLYRLKIWGDRLPFRAQAMPEEIVTPNHRFQPVDTPGHCAHHVVFYEKDKGWLFTGDVFIKIKQHLAFRGENLTQMIESLKQLLKLDFDTIFCSHSGILKSGYHLMEKKLAFLLELQGKVQALEAQGMTPRQIDRELFPVKHPMSKLSEGEGTSYNMVKTLGQI